ILKRSKVHPPASKALWIGAAFWPSQLKHCATIIGQKEKRRIRQKNGGRKMKTGKREIREAESNPGEELGSDSGEELGSDLAIKHFGSHFAIPWSPAQPICPTTCLGSTATEICGSPR